MEETGTGGAGFRYMYAAFMHEAAELFGSAELAGLAEEMDAIGNNWREFSVVSARIIKKRGKEEATFAKAGEVMLNCANREEAFFNNLQKVDQVNLKHEGSGNFRNIFLLSFAG